MEHLLKIFQQTIWQVLGKVITSLSTFIILGLVARNYGEAGTGLFGLALTYLAIFYLLSDFGFNAHLLRKLLDVRDLSLEWRKLFGTRLGWSAFLVILAIGLLPFLPFSTADFESSIYIGSLAIVGSGIFVTCNLIFQNRLRYELSVLSSSLGTLASLMVFVYLSLSRYPVPFLLFAHLIGWLIVALIALVLIRKILSTVSPIFSFRYTINLFKESWPIATTLALNVLYFRADSFLIAYYKPVADVGIYGVAYSVFQSALVLPTFIMNSYYPIMLKSIGGMKHVALGLIGLALTGTIVTFLFAPLIIKILTGGGFVGSAESLQILSLGFPAYFLSSLLMWFFIAKSRYKSIFLLYTLAFLFNLFLNFLYIPKYSFIAASWTTVISEYLILGMQVMLLLTTRKISH